MPRHSSQKLTYDVADRLGRTIVAGTYSGARPLPVEAELARQYGVSRTLMREAVKMLTAKGLIGARPRQGIFVLAEQSWDFLDPDILRWMQERSCSLPLLREFSQLRLAIEPKAAALAAVSATGVQKKDIVSALDRIAASEKGEDDTLLSRIAFHEAVLHATGNRFYARTAAVVQAALRLSARLPERFGAIERLDGHQAVCDAVLAGNPVRAEAAMTALIQQALERIEETDARGRPGTASPQDCFAGDSDPSFPRLSQHLTLQPVAQRDGLE
jgi:DNA-binding FadR family transcriptional regulator